MSEPISNTTAVDYDPFAESGELARVVPTTAAQREVWLADSLGREGSLAFNESISLHLRGDFDATALISALNALIDRHEALRSTVSADGLELLIGAAALIDVEVCDLADFSETEKAMELALRRREAVEQPFDLVKGPLVRATLLRVAADDHVLILTCHHIICDGWSFGIIVRELLAIYSALAHGGTPDLPPADGFADYSAWVAEAGQLQQAETDEAYWVAQYANDAPVLDLPVDRPRPPVRQFDSEREDVLLPIEQVAELRKVAAKSGASLFSLLFGFFSALMARLSAAESVVVGVPSAGQSASGRDRLVGHCVNLLPVRMDVDLAQSAREYVAKSQRAVLDAYDHQQVTFGSILSKLTLDRDPSRMPLVSVQFNLDSRIAPEDLALPGLAATLESNARVYENFEIFINATQAPEGIVLECQYSTALFDGATIRRWMDLYSAALARFVVNPTKSLRELFVPTPAELEIIARQNRTAVALDSAAVVHSVISASASRSHQAAAIVATDETIDYAELERRSNSLARALRERGVARGQLVGLCLPRTPAMVVAQLAVLKAGAAYVPLDPAFPPERLAYMAEDADLSLLVTVSELSSCLAWPRDRSVWLDQDKEAILSRDPAPFAPDPQKDAAPGDAAYVIYTSGSTGKPKGVVVHHRAVVNFLASMAKQPGMNSSDRVVAVTTLSFDIAVLELLLPLTVGATVVLATREQAIDGATLKALMEQSRATIMQATPATWRLLIEVNWRGPAGFKALVGGEGLPQDLARELTARASEVWNMYGPTETTVWSTCWKVPADAGAIRIGTPIDNTQVHVLDESMQPCPIGVGGEMFIGGDGVTLGYFQRDELTAEKFISDPFSGIPGAKLYRTGDRGRWCADGQLEHLGRLDFQVKVRGFRIELGEIETRLSAHPAVDQAVVIVREDQRNDVRLVAYLITNAPLPQTADLKAFLRQTLPEYMLPQHFVKLESFPLTPNGKIDRKKLPAPVVDAADEVRDIAPPRNETEAAIARAMAEILRLPAMSIHDNFFERGGHSLLAAQLSARIEKELGQRPGLRAVFEAPTVAGLAQRLKASGQASSTALQITARTDQSSAPVSLQQQGMWFQEEMYPGGVANNTPSAHRLRGPLDVQAFERALNQLVERQASLRTYVEMRDGELIQRVLPSLVTCVAVEDLSGLDNATRMTTLDDKIQQIVAQPFSLREAPLFRVALFKLGADDHVFFFTAHHIVWDGWSFDVLYTELSELYAAVREGRASHLGKLPVSYGDYASAQREWLAGAELGRQTQHWRSKLLPPPPPLELPLDAPRPVRMSGDGTSYQVMLSPDLTSRLHDFSRKRASTLYSTLLTIYASLVYRLTGQTDFIIGTPVRGREAQHLDSVMGFFVNALPLRMAIEPKASFDKALADVRAVVTDAFSCPDVPFEHLVRELGVPRDPSRALLYQTMFSFQDVRARPTRWADLDHSRYDLALRGATHDLSLACVETHGKGVECQFTYNTDVLTERTVAHLAERFAGLIEQVLASPASSLAEFRLATSAELATLRRWNDTDVEFDRNATTLDRFDVVANEMPGAKAVRFGDVGLTYTELRSRANQFARFLRRRGIGRGALVGLMLERGIDMLVAQLGVLKSGAAYVPMDPAYPSERLAMMAEDAQLALLVTQATLAQSFEWPKERSLWIDAERAEWMAEPGTNLVRDAQSARPEDPAYVIYTSGSTGRPKGVVVHHRGVVNFLQSMAHEPGLARTDRLLAVTTLSFDIAVLELLLPLSVGAEIILANREQTLDGRLLASLLESSKATVLQATPATWRALLDSGWTASGGLKGLIGGEALNPDLAVTLLGRGVELWNMYGPTETTVWSTCWRVVDPRRGISVGTPIANTSVWVLDEHGHPCPPGVPGEMCIGGDGVTLGYLRRDELTAERFIPDPFATRPSAKLYRTGDRGRWLESGRLEHLGRLDFQVKVRGHRIELGEIEAALASHPQVAQVIAHVREDVAGDARIVAYIVPRSAIPEPAELREHARKFLPVYMLPQHYVQLTHVPLLPNGKIDRKSLPKPLENVADGAAGFVPPQTEVGKKIAGIWEELLGVRRVGAQDNFFELGGHSLLAVKMLAAVERTYGVNVPLATLLEAQSCEALAAFVAQQVNAGAGESDGTAAKEQAWRPLVRLRAGDAQLPLFCMHPVGGNVLHYRVLGDAMPEGQPTYGLQSIGLDGLTQPIESLEEMARLYCSEIRSVQPQGPYYLCGGSMGGTIAFEMARQFEEQGERVAFLGLFDTWGPGLRRARAGISEGFASRVADAVFSGNLAQRMQNRMKRRREAQIVEECRARGEPIPQELRPRVIESANYRALAGYAERPYNGLITLFRAGAGHADHPELPDLGWKEVAKGGLRIIELAGSHGDFIEQPAVARTLRDVLLDIQAAEREGRGRGETRARAGG